MILKFFKSKYEQVKEKGVSFGKKLKSLISKGINESVLEELEALFYEADLGTTTTTVLINSIREYAKNHPDGDYLVPVREKLLAIFQKQDSQLTNPQAGIPCVILIVGVNGSGKTTSVAKLAAHLKTKGHRVLLGAADTFRAAAIDQLASWAEKAGVDIVKGNPKSDPSAIVYDVLEAGRAREANYILIDTAGRLQTKTNLMQELEKMRRVCNKVIPGSPHETLMVVDATIGQNGIDQALTFNKFTPITGIILTKLDGSAKGGTVVALQQQLSVPIKFIGTGEGLNDLEAFNPSSFIDGLLSD